MMKLGVLRNIKRVKKYQPGSILESGNNANAMYIIVKGEVDVYLNYRKQNQELLYTLTHGDFFGETAVLLKKSPRTYAVARTDVFALPLGEANIGSFFAEEPELAVELLSAVCARMDAVSAAYEKLSGKPFLHAQPSAAPPSANPASKDAPALLKKREAEKAKASAPSVPLGSFSLFPRDHGKYKPEMNIEDRVFLMEKSYVCPACKHEFRALKVKASRLQIQSTDADMRNRYRGVEPLYFDVVTCPNCLYSALTDMFQSPDKPNAELPEELQALKGRLGLPFEIAPQTDSIFAGYFLALLCAPKYFVKHHTATAKLLLKISRIYQDCGDTALEMEFAKRALEAYQYVYENVETSPGQEQQLCVILGELNVKLGFIKHAKDFFYKAKLNRNGSAILRNHADKRIDDIRDLPDMSHAEDKR